MEDPFSQQANSPNEVNTNSPNQSQYDVTGPTATPGNTKPPRRYWLDLVVAAILVIALSIGAYLLIANHSKKTTPMYSANSCINRTFSSGSSGQCVSDIQNMVNFLETDNLNECPFANGKALAVSGTYDEATTMQVSVVQTWLNCYNKQEGSNVSIPANGIVTSSTWSSICTYAYIYPKQAGQSTSPYFEKSLSAGKNAGC